LFCVFGVFSIVCFELSVPAQVIVWKDPSPKWPLMCWMRHKTLLIHSLWGPLEFMTSARARNSDL